MAEWGWVVVRVEISEITNDDIKDHLKAIHKSLFTAQYGLEMWWLLCGEKTRPLYVDILNKYIECSYALIDITLNSAITSLYKIFENSKKTKNINQVLRKAKKRDIKIEKLEKILTDHKQTINAIKILRNNVGAGIDVNFDCGF